MKRHNHTIAYIIPILIFLLLAIPLISASMVTVTKLDTERYNLTIYKDEHITSHIAKDLDTIVKITKIGNAPIRLGGNNLTLYKTPANISCITLPDNQIGIKNENGSTFILPSNYTLSTYNSTLLLCLHEENIAVCIEKIIDLPVEELITNTRSSQNIQQLNQYELSLEFTALDDPDTIDLTDTYDIYWGDGTASHQKTTEYRVNHTYHKSGEYVQTIELTDEFGYSYEISRTYEIAYEGHIAHTGLWVLEYKIPLIAITSITGLITLFGILFTESGLYLFSAIVASSIPLYTRIDKEDVLDQFVRGQIYGYIKTNPGAHYNQIRREIDVKNGTLAYHLRVLEKTELIKSRKEGARYRAFYPTGCRFPKKERFRLTDLQIRIIKAIKKNPGINQKEISALLHKKPQTINYNINVLEEAELITRDRKGRKTYCYVTEYVEEPDEQTPNILDN